MLAWLIFENVYTSLANYGGFMKLAATILTQARLNFENVCESFGNNNSFYKNIENSLRFKGKSWESLDENHEKEGTTTKSVPWEASFLYKDCQYKLIKCAQVPSENARTRSTWLNNNYL